MKKRVKDNAARFLDFMDANGFDPNYYNKILETSQAVPTSISKYLTEYDQFLLSEEVRYSELEDYTVQGAYGYIESGEMYVPKTLEADDYFRYHNPKTLAKYFSYIVPSVEEFNGAILFHDWTSNYHIPAKAIIELIHTSIEDKYIGFINHLEKGRLSETDRLVAKECLNWLNQTNNDEYTAVYDYERSKGQEFCLIKRK